MHRPPEPNPGGTLKDDGGKRGQKAIFVEKRVVDLPHYPVDALFHMDMSRTVMRSSYDRVRYGHPVIDSYREDHPSILFY